MPDVGHQKRPADRWIQQKIIIYKFLSFFLKIPDMVGTKTL